MEKMALCNGAHERIFRPFERYYTISRENIEAPFIAEAEFHSHNEQYFLLKSAKLSEFDSNEYVFFAEEKNLSKSRLLQLDSIAWERGLLRIAPAYGNMNSDITLVVSADSIEDEAAVYVKKLRHYKSYAFGFKGWSNYKVIVLEASSDRVFSNRMGKVFKKLFCS